MPSGWKYVDLKDAHFIEAGSLKLGTMEDYWALENGRGDPMDGGSAIHAQRIDGRPGSVRALARMNSRFDGTDADLARQRIVIRNSTRVFVGDPFRAFCVSEVGCTYDPTPKTPKAVFQVDDLEALARRVLALHPGQLAGAQVGRVSYRSPVVDAFGPARPPGPSPFVKRPEFARERELRMVFAAPDSPSSITTLFTRPDVGVASMFRRVR